VYDREDGDASQCVTDGTEEDLGCVVVDESHMLDDSECVVILEDMLVHLRFVCVDSVQLVFLSTTMPNIKGLAS
jgi:superfamily II helicase